VISDAPELTLGLFAGMKGEQFFVGIDGQGEDRISLVLREAAILSQAHGERSEPFALTFDGPESNPLQQGTYLFHHASIGAHPIFIVPVSRNRSTCRYQAIFN
jgi:hypothetical protein